MKFKYLLLCAFFLLAMNEPKWNAVLLIQISDSSFNVFVDRYENIQELEMVANIDGEIFYYQLKDTGRRVEIPAGESGWIGVRTKSKKWITSIQLNQINESSYSYLEHRIAEMKQVDEQNGFMEEALVKKEKNELSTQKYSVKAITASDLREVDIPSHHYHIAMPKKILGLDVFEQFMIEYDPYNLGIDIEKMNSRNEVPEEIARTADYMKEHYVAEYDLGDFMIVSEKKSKKKYFFDGYKLFCFKSNEFKLQWEDHAEMFEFFKRHHIKMKPQSKKWLGLYIGDEIIGSFKRRMVYTLKLENDHKLLISSSKGSHTVEIKDSVCEVSIHDGRYMKTFELKEESLTRQTAIDFELAQFQE